MSELPPTSAPLVSISPPAAGLSNFYVHVPEPAAVPHDENEEAVDRLPSQTCRSSYFRIKSGVDRLITAMLTLIALPLMVLIALAILLMDGRPIFYRQVRMGKQGRRFWIWKFRTMRPDAESRTGAVWSSTSDPRITPLGRWLRCSHLDELPQFFNILAGEMNLVGPRPERPEFVQELARELPNYTQRTLVRPGITGLAQLRLGYDHSVADVQKKVRMDLQYIQSASLMRDISLLMHTLPYIARQLVHKWTTVRREAAVRDAEPQSRRRETLVRPPARCVHTGDRTLPAPHLGHDGKGAPNAKAALSRQPSVPSPASRVKDQCA